jgi:asparaginyl-tRNA synthetase
MSDKIATGLGAFSKAKFDSLLNVRSTALDSIRSALAGRGFTEVSTASLVNIAGSCENPHASFTLNYYGREAHLSQSAQIQLESLVLRLRRAVFTVNSSFREENYDDPEMTGRRLSEFTLIEPETPMLGHHPESALDELIRLEEAVLKESTTRLLDCREEDIASLGGDPAYLADVVSKPFERITYDDCLDFLNASGGNYAFGYDLSIREERAILAHFGNRPVFVTHFPTAIKFFNMKRTPDGQRVYSVDLLTPRLGETSGGAVREESGAVIRDSLLHSKVAQVVADTGGDVLETFNEYLSIFDDEPPILRAGFGIGFERFVGFILKSNDILDTIAYRTLRPN